MISDFVGGSANWPQITGYTQKYRITEKLLPNPQDGRVCCVHVRKCVDAGQRQPGKLRAGFKHPNPDTPRRGNLLPGNVQAHEVARR
jgi:hypothetical protein